ncbi:MAG: 5-methyltetrahydropteroyltriglutamate--homocysteine S-methyltransferase [Propylenella sp.]
MPERTTPPFRADHVGSFLRPPDLLKARADAKSGAISKAELRERENAAIRDIVKKQEEIGLKAVTDGEFRRAWFHLDFLSAFSNVEVREATVKARFHTAAGEIQMQPPASYVVGKLTHDRRIFVDDFKFLNSVAKAIPKLTIPSPSLMHFRGGRASVDTNAYPDIEDFHVDLAAGYAAEIRELGAAGCRYLQFDETTLAYLCDPTLKEQVRKAGEDPDALPARYAKLINNSLKGRPAGMTVCMHLCRGNYRSGWVAEGGYEPVAELLFNGIGMDGYFLEYDTERAGNFEPLRFVPKGKTIVLGLISSKTPVLEKADDLKRSIDQAAKYVPLDQLALSPQCGFASTVEGNALTAGEQFAKLRLVVEVARQVWG